MTGIIRFRVISCEWIRVQVWVCTRIVKRFYSPPVSVRTHTYMTFPVICFFMLRKLYVLLFQSWMLDVGAAGFHSPQVSLYNAIRMFRDGRSSTCFINLLYFVCVQLRCCRKAYNCRNRHIAYRRRGNSFGETHFLCRFANVCCIFEFSFAPEKFDSTYASFGQTEGHWIFHFHRLIKKEYKTLQLIHEISRSN